MPKPSARVRAQKLLAEEVQQGLLKGSEEDLDFMQEYVLEMDELDPEIIHPTAVETALPDQLAA
jgi:hypothetical protein